MISTKEHKIIENIDLDWAKKHLTNVSSPSKFLGLYWDWKDGLVHSHYYIGVCWLDIDTRKSLMVSPKIKNLNYLEMFMTCFKHPEVASHLQKIYAIDFEQPAIELETECFELTPWLIIHFLNVVKSIVKKGLKKGYITENQNLSSKVKGKILIPKTIKANHLKHRFDKTYCHYQVFTIDCEENRILKKALVFVQKYLLQNPMNDNLVQILHYNLSFFENVNTETDTNHIKHLKINSFFKEYKEGLQLASMILKRFSYSIQNVSNEIDRKVPPFYINMPLLFELYVLTRLKSEYGESIIYQCTQTTYGIPDFLNTDTKEILDTKYKVKYQDEAYTIEDIRQLSGYARDEKIIDKLKSGDEIIKCVIIYPASENTEEEPIKGFRNLYKIGVKLP